MLYNSTAYILINTEDARSNSGEMQTFADLGGVGVSNRSVPNEIFKLHSTRLLEDVVNHLGLNIQYYGHVYLRDVSCYKTSPVQITPLRDITKPYTITILPKGNNAFEFDDGTGWKKAHFGNKVNTIHGPIAITKTKNYTSDEAYKNYKIIVRVNTPNGTAKALRSGLTVEQIDKYSDIVRLSLNCDNYEMGLDVLNALVVAYNQDAIDDKNSVARNTEAFIAERIESLSQDLSGVDSRIAQLKVAGSSSTMFADPSNGVKYAESAADAGVQLRVASAVRDHIAGTSATDLLPSNTGISDAGIENQISAYNESILKYQKIAATSNAENHPLLQELSGSLAQQKTNIMKSVNQYINSLSLKQSQARAQEGQAIGSMAAVPSQEKAITEVSRQQKIKESLYLYLLNKREENALKLRITEPNAKVVENASGSTTPVYPVPLKIMGLGLLIGLFIPALILYGLYWYYSLDTKIYSRRDVEQGCDLPIVGELPEKMTSQKNKEIVVREEGRDRISEAFRIIRSNLDYLIDYKSTDGGVVMQLSSTMAGEGKSFISLNMALSMAHGGKKVVVIDTDLRKGRFSEYAGITSSHGLSSYLTGNTELADVITKGSLHKNLDFIGVGAIPPNPTNLLMSDNFPKLISELRKNYDFVLLDTVPFGVIADGAIINRNVDLTVYVIRAGKIDKRYLEDLQKLSDEKKIKNIAILINDIKVDAKHYGYGGYRQGYGSYGYGYGYGGYGYGYGYGYGATDEEEKPSLLKRIVNALKKSETSKKE